MITKKLLLRFPKSIADTPIVYRLVKNHDLMVNIFRAKVTPEEEGYLLLDVTGSQENIDNGIAFIESIDVVVNESNRGLQWDSAKCTSCGNCIPRCPTHALHIPDRSTMKVDFASNKCIECLNCIANCPYDACYSAF